MGWRNSGERFKFSQPMNGWRLLGGHFMNSRFSYFSRHVFVMSLKLDSLRTNGGKKQITVTFTFVKYSHQIFGYVLACSSIKCQQSFRFSWNRHRRYNNQNDAQIHVCSANSKMSLFDVNSSLQVEKKRNDKECADTKLVICFKFNLLVNLCSTENSYVVSTFHRS